MLARLREQQPRVVADEAERVDERARPELVGDDHAARVQGVSDALREHEQRVGEERERDRQQAGGEDLGLEDVLLRAR